MNTGKTTILLADDHAIVRRGIKALLEYEPDFAVIAEAGDGLQALSQIETATPQILVTDLCMPNMGGIELLKVIKDRKLDVRCVVLSMCGDAPYISGALEAGAYGYVLKESGVEHLVTAIREAQAGRRYLSPPLTIDEPAVSGFTAPVSAATVIPPVHHIESHKIPHPHFTFETGI